MSFTKFEKYGLLFSSALFLALYFLLSYNNRLASDDLGFFALVHQKSLGESFKYVYANWSGRWASVGYFFTFISLADSLISIQKFIFLYHLVSITIFVYSVYSVLTSVLEYFFETIPAKFVLLNFAILFCAAFYFFTFQNIEVWFWTCSSFCYLQMIIFSCLGLALILNKRRSFLKNIIVTLCFLFVGGALETYSLMLLVLFFTTIFNISKRNNFRLTQIFKTNFAKSIAVAFVFLLFSFIVNLASPGNQKRKQTESAIITTIKSEKNTFNGIFIEQNNLTQADYTQELKEVFFQKKYLAFVFLLFPWILLGGTLKKSKKKQTEFNFSLKKLAILSAALVLLFSGITLAAAFYIYGNTGPLRAWTPFCFLMSVLFCVWSFVTGNRISILSKYKMSLALICFLPAILILGLYFFRQYSLVTKYSAAYDNRINFLNALKGKGTKNTLVVVEPLPDPGMLPGDVNFGLREALNLGFDVEVKKAD